MMMMLDSTGSEKDPVMGSCRNSSRLSGFIKDIELHQLNNYRLLKLFCMELVNEEVLLCRILLNLLSYGSVQHCMDLKKYLLPHNLRIWLNNCLPISEVQMISFSHSAITIQ
jgi:hypothetical protein